MKIWQKGACPTSWGYDTSNFCGRLVGALSGSGNASLVTWSNLLPPPRHADSDLIAALLEPIIRGWLI